MKGTFLAFILCGSALLACQSKPALQLPDNLAPELKNQVEKGWPKVRAACPGFKKYGSDMEFDRIEDNRSSYYEKSISGIDVVFKIADRPETIPVDWRAFGHTCFYRLTDDGKLRISKTCCIAVCKDRLIETNGADYVETLK